MMSHMTEELCVPTFNIRMFVGMSDEERMYPQILSVSVVVSRKYVDGLHETDDVSASIFNYSEYIRSVVGEFEECTFCMIESFGRALFCYTREKFLHNISPEMMYVLQVSVKKMPAIQNITDCAVFSVRGEL